MSNPLVSILIPVYNREHLVGETIESALAQTYSNIELIIVDNCSTDNTWDVLKSYKEKDNRIKIFQNNKNIGPVLNWKRCIDEASGEYVKILFSDDLIEPNFIESAFSVFKENVAFVLADIELFTKDGVRKIKRRYSKSVYSTNQYYCDTLLYGLIGFSVSPGCALFRRKDLSESLVVDIENDLGLDFKKFGAGNDLLLFLLIAKGYDTISIAPDTKALFRDHEDSLTVANNLNVYYDYARYFFISSFFPHWLPKFKSVLWFRFKTRKVSDGVLVLMQSRIDFMFLGKFIWKKFFNDLLKRFFVI
jgi:glycosyltransferase involved in cell wall biosynthesis